MNYYIIILLVLSLSLYNSVSGQPKCHIEHYGLLDGLPQRSVMSIIQDKKGFMWFATWDGLCKFDGYNFTTYKSSQKDTIFMRSNRIDKIVEAPSGYIWVHTYNKEIYCFDPHKEKYITSFNIIDEPFSASEILIMPSGRVWLTSDDMGTICVLDTTNTYKIYSIANQSLPSNNVRTVFEDSDNCSWILTDQGIVRLKQPEKEDAAYKTFFSSDKEHGGRMSFFSAHEMDNEIWFGADKGRIVCYNKKSRKSDIFNTNVKSDIISIKNIYDNLLIILSSEDGFFICDKNKTTLNKFDKSTLTELSSNNMKSCFIDSNNNIWIETDSPGIARFNIITSRLKYYVPVISVIGDYLFPPRFVMAEDKSGRIWVHPRGGGFSYYDKTIDKLIPFYNDPLSPEWKFSHMLHDLCIDRQGNMWISTRTDGVEKISFDSEIFRKSDFIEKPNSLNYEIRALFEDKNNNNIWLGSKENMILVYDSKKKFKGYLTTDGNISKTANPLKVMAYTFTQDTKGNIWIGTKGNGLYFLEERKDKSNSYHIKNYKNNPSDTYSLSNNNVYSVHEDNKGYIWIGTYGGGINLFDKNNGQFINSHNLLKNYPMNTGYQVRAINSLNNIFYVGTTLGLVVFSVNYERPESMTYRVYTRTYKEKNGLRANDIFKIYITRNKKVYIPTQGGGLSFISESDTNGFPSQFKTYDTSNGLPFDIVLSVIEDKHNRLWIVGEGNLSRFDPQQGQVEQFRDIARIIENNFFSEASPLFIKKGEIILGCTKGTLSFDPENIRKDEYKPYIAFTKFKVSGKDYILSTELDDIQKIILSHRENTFSLEYAALDFANPPCISYTYKMEGIENEWIYNQNQRLVNYTNLPPGEYTFRVKSTNSNGEWTDNERILKIVIRPSFWQTQWMYLLYTILFIIVIFAIFRSLFVFYRMRDKVKLEQEQIEIKTRFYTDISHEIRTPLTLIVSPIEDIIENSRVLSDAKPQLQLVLKNANRMLNMVNQILDFRKIQKQKLEIKEVAFGEFISDLCNNFRNTTESKCISLIINNQIESEKIWIDTDSVEKLVYNLVSNAVKYTAPGKKVEVGIFKKDKMFAFQVKDEGKGMTKEIQNKLFTRFASFNTDKSKPSTGIGLSIAKEVADKHHAKIIVDSNVDKGSTFTVLFQPGLNQFSNDENIEIINLDTDNTKQGEPIAFVLDEVKNASNKKPIKEDLLSILIVEDDTDLRSFIKFILSPYYTLYEAKNGREGYELTVKYMPDFILSDIMMPEMDGIELLQKIRNGKETSHIPFILLTAKTSIDDKLEGTTQGADDYITKPFNVKLLKSKIENIIKQRKRLSDYLTKNTPENDLHEDEKEKIKSWITPRDEQFLKNITAVIDKYIDNSELTIDDLVSETNLSRKVFYNKVKGLTGLAPVEFIREIRIKRAALLLKTGEYLIKEVAYMVGFSDIKYFSKCFKHIYGMTPSQYGEIQNQ
ncbi:MAG: response regulator [Bacteroidales bacterium]|jgi:signal transduction histidine kinase/ligand-binding sensor domain-containing protein/DNA-binding response OmpR family regulator|nr:response regulator [Bacteroidales bacterium]